MTGKNTVSDNCSTKSHDTSPKSGLNDWSEHSKYSRSPFLKSWRKQALETHKSKIANVHGGDDSSKMFFESTYSMDGSYLLIETRGRVSTSGSITAVANQAIAANSVHSTPTITTCCKTNTSSTDFEKTEKNDKHVCETSDVSLLTLTPKSKDTTRMASIASVYLDARDDIGDQDGRQQNNNIELRTLETEVDPIELQDNDGREQVIQRDKKPELSSNDYNDTSPKRSTSPMTLSASSSPILSPNAPAYTKFMNSPPSIETFQKNERMQKVNLVLPEIESSVNKFKSRFQAEDDLLIEEVEQQIEFLSPSNYDTLLSEKPKITDSILVHLSKIFGVSPLVRSPSSCAKANRKSGGIGGICKNECSTSPSPSDGYSPDRNYYGTEKNKEFKYNNDPGEMMEKSVSTKEGFQSINEKNRSVWTRMAEYLLSSSRVEGSKGSDGECTVVLTTSSCSTITDIPNTQHSKSNFLSEHLKTVKRRNGQQAGDSDELKPLQIAFVDETHISGNSDIPIYRASMIHDPVMTTGCYYKGFDGKRNHYTLLSPTSRDTPMKRFIGNDKHQVGVFASPARNNLMSHRDRWNSPEMDKSLDGADVVFHVIPAPVRDHDLNRNDTLESGYSELPGCCMKDLITVSSGLERTISPLSLWTDVGYKKCFRGEDEDQQSFHVSSTIDTQEENIIYDFAVSNSDDEDKNTTFHKAQPSNHIQARSKESQFNGKPPLSKDTIISPNHRALPSWTRRRADTFNSVGSRTIGTFGTCDTMHRRSNSTAFFSHESLSLIFDVHQQEDSKNDDGKSNEGSPKPLQRQSYSQDGKNLYTKSYQHASYRSVMSPVASVSKIVKEVECSRCAEEMSPIDDGSSPAGQTNGEMISKKLANNESLHSPLNDKNFTFSIEKNHANLSMKLDFFGYEGKNDTGSPLTIEKTKPIVQNRHIAYLPISSAFRSKLNQELCEFEGWMAFSKGSRLVDSLLLKDGPGIIRTDLRYVVIQGSSMHIFLSTKKEVDKSEADNVKILKITKDMSVESRLISQRYGRCIEVKNKKKFNSTVCTLLPVLIRPEFFRDKELSQVVGQKKFQQIRNSLFEFPDNEMRLNASYGYRKRRKAFTKSYQPEEWPECINQFAPFEQHQAAMYTQFAIDCVIKNCLMRRYK